MRERQKRMIHKVERMEDKRPLAELVRQNGKQIQPCLYEFFKSNEK